MQLNEQNEATDCFALMTKPKIKCKILYDFYNKERKSKCKGCQFFKTKEDYIKGLQGKR